MASAAPPDTREQGAYSGILVDRQGRRHETQGFGISSPPTHPSAAYLVVVRFNGELNIVNARDGSIYWLTSLQLQ